MDTTRLPVRAPSTSCTCNTAEAAGNSCLSQLEASCKLANLEPHNCKQEVLMGCPQLPTCSAGSALRHVSTTPVVVSAEECAAPAQMAAATGRDTSLWPRWKEMGAPSRDTASRTPCEGAAMIVTFRAWPA